MKSQWDCLRRNLGEWQGSFTQLATTGELLGDTPSRLTLQESPDRGTIRLLLERWPEGKPPTEVTLEFGPPGPAPGTLFFECGAFSQGPAQWAPGQSLASELGFTSPERRLRLVPQFQGAVLSRITIIREQRAGATAPERPPLTVADLVGTWQGEATRLFPDLSRSPETFVTTTTVRSPATEQLEFGPDDLLPGTPATRLARVTPTGLQLQTEGQKILLLPDGGFLGYPEKLQLGTAFALEVGWHWTDNCRDRLVRRYGERGEWLDLTWVRETRES